MKITKSQLKNILKEVLSDEQKATLQTIASQIQVYVDDTPEVTLDSTVNQLLLQMAEDATE